MDIINDYFSSINSTETLIAEERFVIFTQQRFSQISRISISFRKTDHRKKKEDEDKEQRTLKAMEFSRVGKTEENQEGLKKERKKRGGIKTEKRNEPGRTPQPEAARCLSSSVFLRLGEFFFFFFFFFSVKKEKEENAKKN